MTVTPLNMIRTLQRPWCHQKKNQCLLSMMTKWQQRRKNGGHFPVIIAIIWMLVGVLLIMGQPWKDKCSPEHCSTIDNISENCHDWGFSSWFWGFNDCGSKNKWKTSHPKSLLIQNNGVLRLLLFKLVSNKLSLESSCRTPWLAMKRWLLDKIHMGIPVQSFGVIKYLKNRYAANDCMVGACLNIDTCTINQIKRATRPHFHSSTYMKPLVHLTVDLLPEILSS